MRRAVLVLSTVLALSLAAPSRAQQSGSDVGGAPAKRRVTKLPRLKKFVSADYPKEKEAAGVEASVILTIEITATGEVSKVTVAQSAGEDFDRAAVAAAKQFEFEPAEVDEKPAPAKISYKYDFILTPPVNVPVPVPEPSPPPTTPAPTAPPQPAPEPTEEVTVTGGPRAPRQSAQVTVRAEQARRVAGTQGDVLKVVQNLPGVSRPPLASGQLVVWGSAPKETRIYVDGVEIPALYHGSGLRSVMSSDLVSSIDLVPGAFGAEYGRGLGGLVRVETRALRKDGVHGFVGADTLDASALVTAALTERVRAGVAGRVSYLDRLLAATSAPDIGDFFPIPRYSDYQAKITADLRKRESVDVVFLGSRDDLTRTVPSLDPARVKTERTRDRFHRLYARYARYDEDGGAATITPFLGYDESALATSFGGAPTRLDVDAWKYGVRATYRARIADRVTGHAGLDTLGAATKLGRAGSLTLPPREGDVTVFGQPPGDEVNADTWSTHILNLAPYVAADVALGPFTVTPGVRFEMFLVDGDRQTPRVGLTPPVGYSRLEGAVDPRLAVRWQATPRLAFTASGGAYHQAPEPEDLSAVFGTPALGLARATHASFGESLRVTDTLTAEMTGFYKTLDDLVVRSQLASPKLARVLVQNGEGRSYGVQFLLRQELWRGFFGWLSYTISRSERRYVEERWRLFDFDQPHVLAVVASQEVGRWTFGARFRYASGAPRTPVTGAFFDARGDQFQPMFGEHNTIRIAPFYQLDLKIERVFPLGETTKLVAFVDVQNVTAHENEEEIVYSPNFRRRDAITGLPTIAVVGGRLEF